MAIIKRPKISVAVITYNQEETISQTLDSILAQKGEYDLELVIGEDCSTDATHAICEEYVRQVNSEERIVKSEIKLLPNTQNLGIMANTARVFKAATGDYISIIAGDDYYSDEYALEKQMQYLRAHEEVGVMAANGYSYYVKRDEKVSGLNPVLEGEQEKVKAYFFSPKHTEGAYLAPVGMMFRAEFIRKYIDFDEMLRRGVPVEDFPMQAILSQHTKFACLPDLLVTYRVYKESASFISYDYPHYVEYYRRLMETRRYLNELFPDDAIPEDVLQERMFNKEFLYDVYHLKYKNAKQLISSAQPEIVKSATVRDARKYACCWLSFAAYHYYKRRLTKKSIKKQI